MKNFLNKAHLTIGILFGFIYFPIYVVGCVLHFISRLLLAISYWLMLELQMAKDIIRHLF